MTQPTQHTEALLTEHFRYTPLTLIDEIINAVNTIVYRAIEAIETGLFSIPPSTLGFGRHSPASARAMPDADDHGLGFGAAKEEIEEGVHRLETLLEATVDKTFDKFEIYTLRNILTVPDELAPWMRLAHYENLPLPLDPRAPNPESILQLRRQVRATHAVNRALRTTQARNASVLSSLTGLLTRVPNPTSAPASSLSFLTASSSPPSQTSPQHALATRAQFATSNLPALRALLASLRPQLESLRAGSAAGSGLEAPSRREERRAYLEGRVRRIVGRGEGAEGERGGRGGEDGGALEGVVGALWGGAGE